MSKSMLAALTLLAVAACGRSDKREVASADSLSRDLQLAPVDTTAPLNDRPSADTATAAPAAPAPAPKPTPKPAAPKPTPKPKPAAPAPSATPAPSPAAPASTPAPAARGLAAGTSFSATTDAEVRSHKNKVGDTVTATIGERCEGRGGARGHSRRGRGHARRDRDQGVGEQERHHGHPDAQAHVDLDQRHIAAASRVHLGRALHPSRTRSTNAGDIAKVGAGTGIGAIVGRVIGGSTKGAVIGGVIGGAVGAQRAVETKDRDVVVPAGTTVTLTLDDRLTTQ